MKRRPVPRRFLCCLLAGLLIFVMPRGAVSVEKESREGIPWEMLDEGLSATTLTGPRISHYADSRITVVRIDPDFYRFELVVATETDSVQRTVKEWCELRNLDGAINAGMYSLKDHISGVGYMQNFSHVNNPVFKADFNAMAAFNPVDSLLPPFIIADLSSQEGKTVAAAYHSCFQSIRMIDRNTQPVYWKKRPPQYCSMTLLALDHSGNVLFIFTRSPYTANEMTKFMLTSALDIKTAMYLEGGPEASLFVRTAQREICKFGSYVSRTNPDDDNAELRKMPNIIGFKRK